MTSEEETNHPYDLLSLIFRPVVFILLGAGIGGALVMLYLTH